MILVDSSVYISWFKERIAPHLQLEPWIRSGQLSSCGLIRAQVVRGILHPAQKARMEEFFDLLPEVPSDTVLWRQVTQMAWRLDRRGEILPLTDLVIGCAALRAGATLITTDPHFDHIPGLRLRNRLPAPATQ